MPDDSVTTDLAGNDRDRGTCLRIEGAPTILDMKRVIVALVATLPLLSGCELFGGGASLSDVCDIEAIGDVFGATGTFPTPEAASASVVDDAQDYEQIGTQAGRPLFAGPDDPPAQVVELEQEQDSWSVFAVRTCRR